MARRQWYPHYIEAFRGDTRMLSMTERGAYRELLDEYYLRGYPLLDDMVGLARICGAETDDEKKSVKSVVEMYFDVREDGLLHNDRADQEIQRVKDLAETRANAGKSGNANRWQKDRKAVAKPSLSTTTTTEVQDQKHVRSAHGLAFQNFWDAWPATPRKVAKAACRKKWDVLKADSLGPQIVAHVKALRQTKQWQDGFEPAPLTYLNQRRWEDEVVQGADNSEPASWV